MIRDPNVLLKFLRDNPQAWPVRMALIEEMVREGEIDRAKTIIRESPDDCPMPDGYPMRIHSLMTRGIEGLESLPPLPGFEDRSDIDEFRKKEDIAPVPPPNSETKSPERPVDISFEALTSTEPSHPEPPDEGEKLTPERTPRHQYDDRPLFDFEEKHGEVNKDGELIVSGVDLRGGVGALVEAKPIRKKQGSKPPPPNIDQQIAAIKWENYSGKLNLEEGQIPEVIGKVSRTGDRFSAFLLAVMAHVFIILGISFVVINTPRPNPPKLIVSMPDPMENDDLIVHRVTKPSDKDPSAASVQSVNVVNSLEFSEFALPDVEDTSMLDVTAMIDGSAKIGAGMTFSPDTHQQSDVNFFGISSGGKRIVFIIDATKPMLVDEKGGMFAYDKVKSEIASMLVNLNRGTRFNILLYEGKQVEAFRDDLVPGLPSNIRKAIEWLDPLNRDYENLGLPRNYGESIEVTDIPGLPIQAVDVAHYTKCIQKAMEWQAAAIFCISAGYERMNRSLTPEQRQMMRDNPGTPGTPGTVSDAERKRYERDLAKWRAAQEKTREWLRKENEARAEKGLAPKVVLDFNALVEQVTGETPPRGPQRTGGTPATPSPVRFERPPPIGFDDIDIHLRKLVIEHYRKEGEDDPSVHMVIFLGEDENLQDDDREHFRRIVKRNNGKFKMLRGLAELKDVTSK